MREADTFPAKSPLAALEHGLGTAVVTGSAIARVIAQRWHHASPATWNRHLATVRSFAH